MHCAGFRYKIVFLRDGTPREVLEELRWHLGLSGRWPADCAVSYDGEPVLCTPSRVAYRHGERWLEPGFPASLS